MHVAVNGWFAGTRVGSGTYTDQVVRALRTSHPEDSYELVSLSRRGNVDKVAFEQLWFARRAAGADVAYVPYWGPPIRSAAPVVVTVHDLIPLVMREYRDSFRLRTYTRLALASTRRAAAVIADSEHTARDLRRRLGFASERVHVIPLGVAPASAVEGPAARLELPDRYGLYLGGFDARKNVATLVAVWKGVYALTGVPLVLAGSLAGKAGAAAATASDGPDIRFVGEVSEAEKAALYGGASVFAYPSRYEGFGLPPLEAMAAGVPVVAADASSLPEVVGSAGILVPPGDQAAWVQALVRVLESEELAAELAARGRARAASFTWARTAEKTRAVLAGVVGGGAP